MNPRLYKRTILSYDIFKRNFNLCRTNSRIGKNRQQTAVLLVDSLCFYQVLRFLGILKLEGIVQRIMYTVQISCTTCTVLLGLRVAVESQLIWRFQARCIKNALCLDVPCRTFILQLFRCVSDDTCQILS